MCSYQSFLQKYTPIFSANVLLRHRASPAQSAPAPNCKWVGRASGLISPSSDRRRGHRRVEKLQLIGGALYISQRATGDAAGKAQGHGGAKSARYARKKQSPHLSMLSPIDRLGRMVAGLGATPGGAAGSPQPPPHQRRKNKKRKAEAECARCPPPLDGKTYTLDEVSDHLVHKKGSASVTLQKWDELGLLPRAVKTCQAHLKRRRDGRMPKGKHGGQTRTWSARKSY